MICFVVGILLVTGCATQHTSLEGPQARESGKPSPTSIRAPGGSQGSTSHSDPTAAPPPLPTLPPPTQGIRQSEPEPVEPPPKQFVWTTTNAVRVKTEEDNPIFWRNLACTVEKAGDVVCFDKTQGTESLRLKTPMEGGVRGLRRLGPDLAQFVYRKGYLWLRRIAPTNPEQAATESVKVTTLFSGKVSVSESAKVHGVWLEQNLAYLALTDKTTQTEATLFRVPVREGQADRAPSSEDLVAAASVSADAVLLLHTTFDGHVSALRGGGRFYFVEKVKKNQTYSAYDEASGRLLWKRTFGPRFVHGLEAGPDGLYIQTSDTIEFWDGKTGQKGRSVAATAQANQGPRWFGEHLYAISKGAVLEFGPGLSHPRRGEAPPTWLLDFLVTEDALVGWAHRQAFVYSRETLRIERDLLLSCECWIPEATWENGTFTFLKSVEIGSGRERFLQTFGRTPAEYVDTSRLPSGVVAFIDGVRLPANGLVPRGTHPLDYFSLGHHSARQMVRVTGTKPVILDPPTLAPVEVRKERQSHFRLHSGSLSRLLRQRATDHRLPVQGGERFLVEDKRIQLSKSDGLTATDVVTGVVIPLISFTDLAEAIRVGLSKEIEGRRLAELDLVSALPLSNLAIVRSTGLDHDVLAAYDLASRRLRWSRTFEHRVYYAGFGENAFSEYAGLLWARDYTDLYGFDEQDGRLVYRYRLGESDIQRGPIFHEGRAYFIYREQLEPSLVALDLMSQKVVWQSPADDRGLLYHEPKGRRLYVVGERHVTSYSYDGKQLAKSASISGTLNANDSHIVTEHAVYIAPTYKNTTHALDPSTLRPRWSTPTKDHPAHIEVLSETEGMAMERGVARVFDLATGRLVHEEIGDRFTGPHPIVQGNGKVCIAGRAAARCYPEVRSRADALREIGVR